MKLLQRLRGVSIRFKLTAVILLLTLGPLLILHISDRYYVQTEMIRQANQTYSMALDQVSSYISDKARLARSLVNMLCGDASVQQQVSFNDMKRPDYTGAWLADVSEHQVIYKGYLLDAVSRVYLYLDGEGASFQETSVYKLLTDEQRKHFDQWYAEENSPNIFLPYSENKLKLKPQFIYLIAKIPSARQLGITYGLIQANISRSIFEDILRKSPASQNAALHLMDGMDNVFISTGDSAVNNEALRLITLQLKAGGSTLKQNMVNIDVEGKRYIAGLASVFGTNWHVVMLVPYTDVVGIMQNTNRFLLITMLLLALLVLPLTTLIIRVFTRPILSLKKGVAAITNGNYDVSVPRCGDAEIDQVIDSFNIMAAKTRETMTHQYEMGQALKSAELQVLQEQINPHFLYNTLDLLHWQARRAKADDIEDVVFTLSEFYKLSLGHGEEIVTIEHELRHVAAYMHIQNVRFMNRIQLVIDVPEIIRTHPIVKIILQPLVENSIQHGIREKDDESGTILITGRIDADELVLSVADDGVGMDEETLESILTRDRRGYGVYNVNYRLALHYGRKSCLQYTSCLGKGTTATMRIPYIRQLQR